MSECIVLGSARRVWLDLAEAGGAQGRDVMAVNDIGMHYPGDLTHWYSNDAKMLGHWSDARRPGYSKAGALHSNNPGRQGVRVWDNLVGGNSAVNAVCVALELGYERVIVCGVPLDETGHYFDPPWINTSYNNEAEFDEWRRRVAYFAGRVTSMSGKTREILSGNTDN